MIVWALYNSNNTKNFFDQPWQKVFWPKYHWPPNLIWPFWEDASGVQDFLIASQSDIWQTKCRKCCFIMQRFSIVSCNWQPWQSTMRLFCFSFYKTPLQCCRTQWVCLKPLSTYWNHKNTKSVCDVYINLKSVQKKENLPQIREKNTFTQLHNISPSIQLLQNSTS